MSNNYFIFLKKLKKKYKFKFFNEKILKYNNIILRHDVDYHIDYALELAKIEKKLNIKSTYFFLLRSDFYNLFSFESINKINIIKKLGHKVSLHFDEKIYNKNWKIHFFREIFFFEAIMNVKIDVISFHRPLKKYIQSNKSIFGISHAYQSKYTKKIKYFSDSRNEFSYGNPLSILEHSKNISMQILIHPIWWVSKFGQKSKIKFKKLLQDKQNQLIKNGKLNNNFFTL
jgi:hypothetical protein